MLLLNAFAESVPISRAAETIRLSENTIRHFYQTIREQIAADVQTSSKIGGPGTIVEVDEAKFGKRKYNRGRMVHGSWVLGGIQRGSDSCFLTICPENVRDAPTLTGLIISEHLNLEEWIPLSALLHHPPPLSLVRLLFRISNSEIVKIAGRRTTLDYLLENYSGTYPSAVYIERHYWLPQHERDLVPSLLVLPTILLSFLVPLKLLYLLDEEELLHQILIMLA